MGTRGCYGFRKNGIDKLTYNGHDSYPDGLGAGMVNFCSNTSIAEMNAIFEKIIMVDSEAKPTLEQIAECATYAILRISDLPASRRQNTDAWYCLLGKAEGDLNVYKQGLQYMTNAYNFIKDSLFCEYAYIINLDSEKLEFWRGFQRKPQNNNRYGQAACADGYYPCALAYEFDLKAIPENVLDIMNGIK